MLINQQFIDDFTQRIEQADGKVRLAQKTSWWQRESSMLPLHNALNGYLGQNVDWDGVGNVLGPILLAIRPDRQRKYAVAIKFLIKSLRGDGSQMFTALKAIVGVTKLSKSQQRFTVQLVEGDHGHGLCLQMALLWTKERLVFHVSSDFPRLDDKNVAASKDARKVAIRAIENMAYSNEVGAAAARLGLTATQIAGSYSFDNVHRAFVIDPDRRAVVLLFYNHTHAVAIVRESQRAFQFYDANAGSYRIQTDQLQTFLATYNNLCLPLKWPGYNLGVDDTFDGIHSVVAA